MAEETKGPTEPVAKSIEAPPKTLGEVHATQAANAPSPAQNAARPATTLELALELKSRVTELEHAFHGYLTHEGALHPKVTGWVNKFRARLAAAIAPASDCAQCHGEGGDSEPPAA